MPQPDTLFAAFGKMSDPCAEALERAGVRWIEGTGRCCTVEDVRAAAKRFGAGEVEVSPEVARELRWQILGVESNVNPGAAIQTIDVFGGDGSFGWAT